MTRRTDFKDRCHGCFMREVLCLCGIIPRFELKTKLLLVIHKREVPKTTNTGRLAMKCLPNSEMRVRGDFMNPSAPGSLVEGGRETLFLYPSDDAIALTPDFAAQITRPVTLIVPDGSWRQASKVATREPGMHAVKRVKLTGGAPTRYRLRRESKPEGLATFEAIARAFGIFEGAAVQEKLEEIFQIMVERTLWSRGDMRTENCRGGIPQKALDEALRVGLRGPRPKAGV